MATPITYAATTNLRRENLGWFWSAHSQSMVDDQMLVKSYENDKLLVRTMHAWMAWWTFLLAYLLKYLVMGIAPRLFICSRKLLKSNGISGISSDRLLGRRGCAGVSADERLLFGNSCTVCERIPSFSLSPSNWLMMCSNSWSFLIWSSSGVRSWFKDGEPKGVSNALVDSSCCLGASVVVSKCEVSLLNWVKRNLDTTIVSFHFLILLLLCWTYSSSVSLSTETNSSDDGTLGADVPEASFSDSFIVTLFWKAVFNRSLSTLSWSTLAAPEVLSLEWSIFVKGFGCVSGGIFCFWVTFPQFFQGAKALSHWPRLSVGQRDLLSSTPFF